MKKYAGRIYESICRRGCNNHTIAGDVIALIKYNTFLFACEASRSAVRSRQTLLLQSGNQT
jgi:hypothetical protein